MINWAANFASKPLNLAVIMSLWLTRNHGKLRIVNGAQCAPLCGGGPGQVRGGEGQGFHPCPPPTPPPNPCKRKPGKRGLRPHLPRLKMTLTWWHSRLPCAHMLKEESNAAYGAAVPATIVVTRGGLGHNPEWEDEL